MTEKNVIRVTTHGGQVFRLEKNSNGEWYVTYVVRQMALMFRERIIKVVKCEEGEPFELICADHLGHQDVLKSEMNVKLIE